MSNLFVGLCGREGEGLLVRIGYDEHAFHGSDGDGAKLGSIHAAILHGVECTAVAQVGIVLCEGVTHEVPVGEVEAGGGVGHVEGHVLGVAGVTSAGEDEFGAFLAGIEIALAVD